uniref:Restriction endonuclease n=1 Tax=Panagrellus redivivus TaxID=6233 RepID=A0A7E4W2X3_PANRE
MSNDSTPINFAKPVYPPAGFRPLEVSYPSLTDKDKGKLLGDNEEFPKFPVEPATMAPQRDLWLKSGVETQSGKEFTQLLKEELIRAGFHTEKTADNAME